ncbi:site-specific integrase [Paenibacillus sp. MZ04-78.2]|uniref:tyrosine-type recombinase/integrase n=1 Tax=Paenibacillus sp. MZ04-78.2 TaxID=2962034 RepID=UPI0020B6AD5D|nr:site-specific integrase [Paenibacillus sp. MZ04-78.2]MCP3776698.1 site-specific integrase [Paenibacillus sp. MZ04-78.2]
MKPTDFAKALSQYLTAYLPGQRNMSPNTISSYRDTFKLFLTYCKQSRLSIERLSFAQVDESLILAFLKWLEEERNNGISTRNQRLACIHAFFRYVQAEHPVGLLTYQKILAIPMKKAPKPTVKHLTPDSLQLILGQPDLSTASGRRDATLLSVLYDTGARVQELVDLRVRDVRLDPPPVLR